MLPTASRSRLAVDGLTVIELRALKVLVRTRVKNIIREGADNTHDPIVGDGIPAGTPKHYNWMADLTVMRAKQDERNAAADRDSF